ncbi:MAG: hypothetical protein GY711_17060 [bacterium]|nr:hypothetical protein [bacterium]
MPRLLLLLSAVIALAAPLGAQGRTIKLGDLGLTLSRPSGYTAVPLPPRMEYTVLQLVEGGGSPEGEVSPTLLVHVVVRPVTGVRRGKIVDTKTFLDRFIRPRASKSLRGGAQRYGHKPKRFEIEWEDEGLAYKSFVHGWEGPWRTVIVQGVASPADYDQHRRRWQQVAETMKLENPREDGERAKLERFYAQHRFGDVEYRIDVRLALVDGWKAKDTEHYIILYNESNAGFVDRVGSDLESLRRDLERDLPSEHRSENAATVRLCRDRAEYLAYGGMKTALGYFSPAEEELVLYQQEQSEGADETFQTLYHEAFHQYVYTSAGHLAPHSWFDEGMGEYYAGARLERGRVDSIELLPNSLGFIQYKVARGEHAPLSELIAMEQADYYADAQLHYTQGWSFVYFLRTSSEVRRKGSWAKILPTYFSTLKETHSRELGESTSGVQRVLAGQVARQEALAAAFAGVDLRQLEIAWVRYVQGLKN